MEKQTYEAHILADTSVFLEAINKGGCAKYLGLLSYPGYQFYITNQILDELKDCNFKPKDIQVIQVDEIDEVFKGITVTRQAKYCLYYKKPSNADKSLMQALASHPQANILISKDSDLFNIGLDGIIENKFNKKVRVFKLKKFYDLNTRKLRPFASSLPLAWQYFKTRWMPIEKNNTGFDRRHQKIFGNK